MVRMLHKGYCLVLLYNSFWRLIDIYIYNNNIFIYTHRHRYPQVVFIMLKPPLDWPDMGALRFPFHRISAQTEEPGGAAVPVKYTKDGAHRQLLPNSWPHIQPNIRWDVFRIRSQKLISMWVVSLALRSCKKTSMHAIYCKFLP